MPATSAGSTPTHRNSPDHPGTATSAKPTTTPRAQAEGPSSTDRPSPAGQDSSTGDRSSSAEQQSKSRPAKSKPTKPKLRVLSSGTCGASYYGESQMTAGGERFGPNALTAAHKTLPLGSRVRVTNPRTGESVTVRINDRGPYIGGRCLDLSTAAFAAIGNTGAGVMRVRYEVLAR
ncbi:septal ring lytic transglycosylase RlpA family protein [Nonomuraea sp. NPDC004580]|uniref:septal ring lytic transglycosylase RlpA family protein n=1 Tax=Nonomuraea sp. NPDC004580 TaxID=3154552 RepID=UPI00339E530A